MLPETQSSGERLADIGEIQLCYETFGDQGDPPLLLIMGLATQMVWWEDDFCRQLADRGFWVTRFDNRDIGRSTVLSDKPVPTRAQLFMRDRKAASYALDAMAGDAAKLLDHLGVERRRRWRVDGRDDRAAAGDPTPGARPLARLDHVEHGQSGTAASHTRRHGDDDAPGARSRRR